MRQLLLLNRKMSTKEHENKDDVVDIYGLTSTCVFVWMCNYQDIVSFHSLLLHINCWKSFNVKFSGVSLWCNGQSDGLRSKRVRTWYYVIIRANTLGKGMNPLILPVMG